MADILIKNMTLPTEDEQVNITILSDGSVIEHWLLTELEYERIEVTSICEKKRNQLKLVEASTSSLN